MDMNKIKGLGNLLFIDRFPKIDLHGFDRDSARVCVEDFVLENKKLKNEICVIIHGVGNGILKTTTQDVLRKNKHVEAYQIHYFNQGCTIVKLKIDK